MRITDRAGPNAVGGSAATQRPRAAGTRFALADAGGAVRLAGAQQAAPAAALDGLLAIQAAGDTLERRKRAIRRAHGLLDSLDRLKIALLSGRVSNAELLTIRAQLMQQREQAGDPALDELLAHVELRAEVELAKLGKR